MVALLCRSSLVTQMRLMKWSHTLIVSRVKMFISHQSFIMKSAEFVKMRSLLLLSMLMLTLAHRRSFLSNRVSRSRLRQTVGTVIGFLISHMSLARLLCSQKRLPMHIKMMVATFPAGIQPNYFECQILATRSMSRLTLLKQQLMALSIPLMRLIKSMVK